MSRRCACCSRAETAAQPLHACTRCRGDAYCDKTCQQAHWKTHKPLCRAIVTKQVGSGSNLIIMLHGMGDTCDSMMSFAKAVAVPDTTCIAVQAPLEVGILPGFMWYAEPDLADAFPHLPEAMRTPKAGLERARGPIHHIITEWRADHRTGAILLLGYGQGGVAAVDAALSSPVQVNAAITISGGLQPMTRHPASALDSSWTQFACSVYISHGARDERTPLAAVRKQAASLNARLAMPAEMHAYDKGCDMPRSEGEMRDLLAFIAAHTVRPSPVLEGLAARGEIIEIGQHTTVVKKDNAEE